MVDRDFREAGLLDLSCCCRCAHPGEEVVAPHQMVRVMDAVGDDSSGEEEEIKIFSPMRVPAVKPPAAVTNGSRDSFAPKSPQGNEIPGVEQWSSLGRMRPQDLDLSELTRGNQSLRISKAERRGITFEQLKKILVFLKKRCDENGSVRGWYDPRTGEPLHYRTINLRQLNYWVLRPVTEKRQCSYVEAIAKDDHAQLPAWFVGHTWGEPFIEFVRRCMKCGTLGAGDAFWSYAFASRLDDCSEMTVGSQPSVVDFHALHRLKVCFDGSTRLRSMDELQRGLPPLQNMISLDLDLSKCPKLSAVSSLGEGLATLQSLTSLRLCFSGCTALQNADGLCRGLAVLGSQLVALELIFAGCSDLKHLGGGSSSANSPGGCCLPSLKSLRSLKVDCRGCSSLSSVDIVSEDMQAMASLELNFSGCTSLVELMAVTRPLVKFTSMTAFELHLARCSSLRSLGELHDHLRGITVLSSLRVDLSSCPALDESVKQQLNGILSEIGSGCATETSRNCSVASSSTRCQL
eukprot:gb/GFBE01005314.1/.p1 GENE.gb/GFBE01005314.1/~~gb/GFBE01005314.1/.p1  ORF type:complete len:519 (+),score=85.88 gb/GFBE01005314.1/:1-1557(+)